jgi:4-amino-4-deoxy-L-arabinose transferase-like glycosyltransferase
LVVLLAAGMTLRATLLEVVPGELHPDEGGLAIFTQLHVYPRAGLTVNPFVTGSVVQPTLHSYVLYLGMAIAGKSIAALRLSSALVGSLAILACYAAVATIDGRRTGLLAAAIMTTYHYHIHWSRLALNNVWDTLWVPLVLAAFAWGWKRKWSGGAVLAGLALGLSQYFYAGNKVVVILLPVLAAQLWREDPDRRRMGIHLSKLLATAFCAAIPLALFALSNPEIYFARIPQIIGWHPAAVLEATGSSSDWAGYFWHQARRALGAYVAYTDITGFYGPGIAFTFGASACAFGLGTLWAIRSRRWVPLAWALLTAILGGFMLLTPPSSSHYVVSIPAVAWLIALPLDALIARGWGNVAAVSLGAIMASDLLFYFGVYVPQGAPHLSVPFPLLPSP